MMIKERIECQRWLSVCFLLLVLSFSTLAHLAVALSLRQLHPVSPSVVSRHLGKIHHRPTSRLYERRGGGILGRFRKKRTVEQTKQIRIGDVLPDVDVELLLSSGSSTPESIHQVLKTAGGGSALLVGECVIFFLLWKEIQACT
jgi:hypothetical protein